MKKYLMLTMRAKAFLLSLLLSNTTGIQAQTSKVNVTIDGPGVVDEYYIPSADGKKQVKLKAVPSKFLGNVTFNGWSGDATGTSEELTVDADKAQNIHAKFSWRRPTRKYPLLDLKLPNADHKNYYIEEKCYEFHNPRAWRGSNYIPIDYNRDGYIDFVEFAMKGSFGTNDHRENVRFWLANEDGTYTEDPKNDDKLVGAVFCNRFAYPDLNEDGYPDFCAFSTGYDRDGSTYDHPLILMSDATCTYHEVRYPEHVQYFHGGTSGDFNNDGHVDVLFLSIAHFYESVLLVNEGNGVLKETDPREVFKFDDLFAEYGGIAPVYLDCEFCDLNNDGFLDFILCGNDWFDSDTYNVPPMVFWGDGKTFSPERSAKLLDTPFGYGISHSPVFYDLNGDGVKEIIMTKLGDGTFGGSVFYKGVIHQVFELDGSEYVDKTDQYIPVQYEIKETLRTWMEEIDGRVFLCNGEHDESYTPEVAACPGSFKVYELVDGILKPVYYPTTTKIDTYDEGFAIYADKPTLVDYFNYDDGLNPNDLGVAWGATEQWDGIPSGDMWRIDPHYGNNTHFGNSCIRWDRDGLDPKTEYGKQSIWFNFISEVDIKHLLYEGYYLELYIKNSDPDLSLLINGVTLDVSNTDEGKFTGEWQRMTCPIFKIVYNSDKFMSLGIEVDKGDLNNEFYLDDIRVRRLSISESKDEYERAFRKDYVDGSYYNKERTTQITSQEFKSLLKPLVEKYAPAKMDYFNERISDTNLPLTRNIAVGMAYYTAICIGADTGNYSDNAEQPADFWDGCWYPEVNQVLPHANDEPTTSIGPDDNFWMEWQEIMQAVMWNACHVSDFSGMRVVPIDKDANTYHWLNPFTWEDAICAITRLYDSLDPGKKAVGDVNGDGVVNVADIVELINGDGKVNAEDIKAIVNIIMVK